MKANFETLLQARKAFKEITGTEYNLAGRQYSGLRIYRNKNRKLKRRYFLGTYLDWLNK